MNKLQVLSPQLANMIAAGEVVQRPASVVKELMENAVDAGSSDIQVIIKDSGRTLIQVIDNGCGMNSEDAVLCFARHATSKISSPADLENILTFGFRGEALASIAAVAQVTLKTRREEDEVGTQVVISAAEPPKISSVSKSRGTNIEVRNLFYNVPARRKFLKSDSSEFKHIVEEFSRIAIVRPEISFTLRHNDKDILILKKAAGLKFRILDTLGKGVVGEIVDLVTSQTAELSISGYIGRPDSAKKALGNQYFYVNGRYFRSPYLHKAVMNAYSEMTPEGLTPSYILFLQVDPHSVDVNVSPTKAEIKFENEQIVFQTVYACVRETLGKNGFGEMIDFDAESALKLPQLSQSNNDFNQNEINAALGDWQSDYNPFEAKEPSAPAYYPAGGYPQTKHTDYSALFADESAQKKTQRHIIIGDKYIATSVDGGLLLTNIRRAEIRINYENIVASISGQQSICQTALFPIQIQIGAAYIPLIEENEDLLRKLGFDITVFGNDTIVVAGIPQWYDFDEMSVKNLVAELLQTLEEEQRSLSEAMTDGIARKLAEYSASASMHIKDEQQAQILLDKLHACANQETVPSGKRIGRLLTLDDLDKQL